MGLGLASWCGAKHIKREKMTKTCLIIKNTQNTQYLHQTKVNL